MYLFRFLVHFFQFKIWPGIKSRRRCTWWIFSLTPVEKIRWRLLISRYLQFWDRSLLVEDKGSLLPLNVGVLNLFDSFRILCWYLWRMDCGWCCIFVYIIHMTLSTFYLYVFILWLYKSNMIIFIVLFSLVVFHRVLSKSHR